MDRPSLSFNLEVEGYGMLIFPVAVVYDSPSDTWASFCLSLEVASCAGTLEDAVIGVRDAVMGYLAVHKRNGNLDNVMRAAGYEEGS